MKLEELKNGIATFSFHIDDLQALVKVLRTGTAELITIEEAQVCALGQAMATAFDAAAIAAQTQMDMRGGDRGAGDQV
jgi:hypothetical protein